MTIVCRNKPNRTRPRPFNLRALERVSCSVFENGLGTPDEIREACETCLPPKEEDECQEERELIEQIAPLLFAGLATLAMVIPLFRGVQVLRRAAGIFRTVIENLISSVPWVRRFFARPGAREITGATDEFAAAAAQLNPQYIRAIATTARILNRLQKRIEVAGPLLFLLALVGVSVDEFQPTEEDA